MQKDVLVPVPLCAGAVTVSAWIAFLILGDMTGWYTTEIGSHIVRWIYDYPTWERYDLVRYHEEEGAALFVALSWPMLLAVYGCLAYQLMRVALRRLLARFVSRAAEPAE